MWVNWKERKTKQNETRELGKKYENEKEWDEEHTKATLPIPDNALFVREGKEKDGEEIGVFLTSTSPGHPVIPHGLVIGINKAVEPTISLKIVTLELRGADIQNRLITNKDPDEELASLHKKMNDLIRKT